jgi:hypothetical protein
MGIYTDDMERAKNFYSDVFYWGFNTYGPEDFLQIKAGKSEHGDLRAPLKTPFF